MQNRIYAIIQTEYNFGLLAWFKNQSYQEDEISFVILINFLQHDIIKVFMLFLALFKFLMT